MRQSTITSPLYSNDKATLRKTIPKTEIIEKFERELDMDISHFFSTIENFHIYECNRSGYRFYYPYNLSGDSKFYEILSKIDWYYMPWKWEHEETTKLLHNNEKILEVGSGGLGFVEKLVKMGFDVTGLELNKESIKKAKEKKLNIIDQSIQEFSSKSKNNFDVVCSYQVLEHISEVYSFVESQVACLKKGGKLIISVPNNETFLRLNGGGTLNYPPHHMGLWNTKSLKSLAEIFNLEVTKVLYEPLQKYHVEWYVNTITRKQISKKGFLYFLLEKLHLKTVLRFFISIFRRSIKGHTIMVVYKKI